MDFLVPEMPHAREHHSHVMRVGSSDDFSIANGTARLHGRGGTRFGRGNQAIREREKRITADDAAFER